MGITPAYAGKRQPPAIWHTLPWDHPRICGEKTKFSDHFKAKEGSPPHMRGKDFNQSRRGRVLGITPAYAGKSDEIRLVLDCKRDHPRICGEKFVLPFFFASSKGSPPHMRGKGSDRVGQIRNLGITPAYAGKSIKTNQHVITS